MKKQLIILSIAAMTSGAVFAAGAPVANQFSAGQPARAADVNANFQELADRTDVNATGVASNASNITTNTSGVAANASGVASNTAEIDTNIADIATNASDIAANTTAIVALGGSVSEIIQFAVNEKILTKRFVDATPETVGECDVLNESFVFNVGEKTFVKTMIIENSSDQTECWVVQRDWDYNDGLATTGHTNIKSPYGQTVQKYSIKPSSVLLKDKARVGETWGAYHTSVTTDEGGNVIGTSSYLEKTTLLGYQDVTVAAGMKDNCLLIERGNVIYYYCDGWGITRRIVTNSGSEWNWDWQLESYTAQ